MNLWHRIQYLTRSDEENRIFHPYSIKRIRGRQTKKPAITGFECLFGRRHEIGGSHEFSGWHAKTVQAERVQ